MTGKKIHRVAVIGAGPAGATCQRASLAADHRQIACGRNIERQDVAGGTW